MTPLSWQMVLAEVFVVYGVVRKVFRAMGKFLHTHLSAVSYGTVQVTKFWLPSLASLVPKPN